MAIEVVELTDLPDRAKMDKDSASYRALPEVRDYMLFFRKDLA